MKDGGVWDRGGWNCYITNVIKQAAIVAEFKRIPVEKKRRVAGQWRDILQWELGNVKPDRIFCLGHKSYRLVEWLRANARLDTHGRCQRIWHYSAPYSHEKMEREMRNGIEPYL